MSILIAGLAFDDARLRTDAIVGVLLAALGATIVGWLVFAGTRRRSGSNTADLPRTLSRPVDTNVDHIRGRHDAPLTLVEYGDFQCPFCARVTGVARELLDSFGDDLRYVFRHLPLTDLHPQADLAARAAEAAARQGQFWGMHDLLFSQQGEFTLEQLVGFAADLDLDIDPFATDLERTDLAQRIRDDIASAEASGARGTPTFFVEDRRHVGPYDAETLRRVLDAARARDRSSSGLTSSDAE